MSDHLQYTRRVVSSVVVIFLIASMPVMAAAQPQGQDNQAREERAGAVTQEQALDRVRARFPGTVISINEVRQGGRLRYRVRLDNEGNIYTVFVDQATGALSRE